ncbi:3,4-dihydroxy-2-butanone 4-phosphate synthase-domain-containing protein [Lentinula aciculospora]|uniref:3,4-dihydroxy-2-butanone 4-phosphate synthase n=1 Tax=Lentinula aciculospora TaxID=153920 RepID=A0A9W8ZYA3_9AGAR|nr:3,4-dihydroxy-2-butanone 4-phosphate synthase-domain-containing protein [Lentinula aciculospora]
MLSNNPTSTHLNGIKELKQPTQATQFRALIDSQRQRKTADRPQYNPNPSIREQFSFDSIQDALQAYKRGEFLVVMDDEIRENEGDLIIAGFHCTTEKMAWMIRHTSGFICISLPGERLAELDLPMMLSEENQDPHGTAYTISTDYRHGTTTGISAHDRALTAFALSSSTSVSSDFTRPGHLLPLRARPGGILTRRGHTEAGVDLCKLTGLPEAGVLCELVNDLDEDVSGGMMRRDQCRVFADKWGLKMISVEMLAEFRRTLEA